MIGYLLTYQVWASVVVYSRPNNFAEEILNKLTENDANLNAGFNLHAFRIHQLSLHNHYRALHGVPAMTIDTALQNQAQKYAETLAAYNNGLKHCNLPSCNRHGAGENLAMSSGSTTAEVNATKAWYQEIWDYDFCNPPQNRPGHEGKAVLHFTQVVWKTSTKLGIGYARSSNRKAVYVVGRYAAHGNNGQYKENVPKANYLFNTFKDSCDGQNGGLTGWLSPGKCSQSCGGGIRFQKKTCTNPKPSLNGRDCSGVTKQLAAKQWCNVQKCPGSLNHREKQCQERGYPAKAYNFGGRSECKLHCYQSKGIYMLLGNVEDGTHCNSDNGVCVEGKCVGMPKYIEGTKPAEPPRSKAIDGRFSPWSAPGRCSRRCGGGVKFQTRTCTNPRPSNGGADCSGVSKKLAAKEWCNTGKCKGKLSHRDKQCRARGYSAKAYNFVKIYGQSEDCKLHCHSHKNFYTHRGSVDDGTHCNSDSGVCVGGVCDKSMPNYVTVTNGGFSPWSAPGRCSRRCGGGVKFQTRTCTNPRPSNGGADCFGATKKLAAKKWCNTQKCTGKLSHRDKQCKARGYTAKAYNFVNIYGKSEDCKLHCHSHSNVYTHRGSVDDGTHCNSDSGVCINGVCDKSMPDY